MTESEKNVLSPSEMLQNRLYVTPKAKYENIQPRIMPDNNPIYPKRITHIKNLSAANRVGNTHFTQLSSIPQPLQNKTAKRRDNQDQRLIITQLEEPLDAVKKLQDSPPGTFFYMQKVSILQNLISRQLGIVDFDPQLVLGSVSKLTQILFSQDAGSSEDQHKRFQFSREDIELLCQKQPYDLLVCPHTYICINDYYTLSSLGITRISKDQHSFTKLEEWTTELVKLQKLREISIFKNFRLWKPLKLLKKAVKQNRQLLAAQLLNRNLFTINKYLKYSLSITLNCTNGIRFMNIVVTQKDLDEMILAKQQLRKQRNKMAGVRHRAATDPETIKLQNFIDAPYRYMLKMFEYFNERKQIRSFEEMQNEENHTENETQFETEDGQQSFNPYGQEKLFKYPFTVQEFNQMTEDRCRDMSMLFDQLMTSMLICIKYMVNQVITQQFGQKSDNSDERTIKTTITSYTERAARLNVCKRLHSYLRLTDFMIMDSLYDFQYTQLKKFYERMYQAGQFELPRYDQVIASQEELLERERIGMYLFDGKEADDQNDDDNSASNNQDVLEDQEKVITVGDGSKSLFLGFVQCQVTPGEPKTGCIDLRTSEDVQTPGDQVMPGQSAQIQLYPSADDFHNSFDNLNESLLSILDCIKRLTNHEDFAEVTLPIFTNTDATFEHVDDQNKLLILQEINVPTLHVLFANNPAFRILVNNIKNEIYSQYQKVVAWSKTLQPFYDAFNQCMNLNVTQLQQKFLKVPLSAYGGEDLINPDKKWLANFQKVMTTEVYVENNDYQTVLDEFMQIDFKDVAIQAEAFVNLVIKTRHDVPLCSKSGLNKNSILDQLFSDEEFDDLLKQMEHNRRLHYSMPQEINLGLYTFSCEELKTAFLPAAQRCLNFLRTLVPIAVVKRLTIMYINILGLRKYLSRTYETIEEYILFREVVQLLSDEVVDVIKAFQSNTVQFLAMFENHCAKIQPQVTNFLQFFGQQFDLFKNQVIAAEQTLDSKTSKWLKVQEQNCVECQAELEGLKTKLRLKILNSPVEMFTIGDISAFMYDYEAKTREIRKENDQLKIQLETAQNEKDKLEASKLDATAVDERIMDLEEKILPDFMVVNQSELDCDIIIRQHKFYVTKEYEEEEVEEPDVIEEEKVINEEKEEDEIVPESENVTAVSTTVKEEAAEEKSSDSINLEEEDAAKYVPEKTLHARISTALTVIEFKVRKTQAIKEELDAVEARIKQVRGYQQSLSAEPHEFELLDTVSGQIRQYYNLWTNCKQWYHNLIVFVRQNFLGDLNQEDLNKLVAATGKVAFQCEKQLPTSEMPGILKQRVNEVRQLLPIVASLDNQALRDYHWKNVSDILKTSIPMVELKIKKEIDAVENETDDQTEDKDDEQDETAEQQAEAEQTAKKYEIVTVQKPQVNIIWLVKNSAMVYRDQLSQISSNAANEASLEKQFRKIDTEWQNVKLKTTNYKDSTDVYVLKDINDIITKLQDTILVVSGIACSRYVGEMKETVESLFDKLKQLDVVLDLFLKVQKGYLYLLNIFSSNDIQRQLQTEFQLFNTLDEFWKQLLQNVQFYPQAIKIIALEIVKPKDDSQLTNLSLKPSPLERQLKYFEMLIDQIQKSLDNYLQSKRMAFPRLFFISDDELLDLLAQAKNPYSLQTHMRKLFENVAQIEIVNNLQAGGLEIVSLISEEGEKLHLVNSVKPRGTVTTWLKTLEQKMRQSVAKQLKSAIDGYQNYQSRNQWILNNLGQCIIAGSQVFWCSYITEALDGRSDLSEAGYGRLKGESSIFKDIGSDKSRRVSPLQLYYNKFEADLQNLITLIKSNLTKLQRGAITALATIETHSRDTIQELMGYKGLQSTEDFQFQKLQRYYYNPIEIENPVYIKQNTTVMPYQNEYLGASSRLVITPLTDLVYLHIAVSVQNCKAINLAGPAGTGKSETTKDQNKSRANACVVFNCSENVEISVMNRFFMGFCMTGAGSCLDEFNRLELSLLSVIAGSIKQILDGLRMVRANVDGDRNFIFNGYELSLHPDTMIAISLNPGYAGRAELPQNLKNLFRSFSMVVPDYSLISEIILFSQGFTTAKPLSRKVVQLYKLSSEQLSQQNSYDFGMRGVKSVLSMAGNFRRKFPDQSEEFLLIRAMQDSNLPRMIAEDRDLFMGIVQDLFPNIVYKQTPNNDFITCIEKSLKKNRYQINPTLITKINQVFETCQIRHGVLLMGPAKSGKTLCLRTLTEALGFLREMVEAEFPPEKKKLFDSNYPYTVVNPTDIHLINSKAITLNELYGSYDESSGEWKDGLLGNIMRTALDATAEVGLGTHKQFILFDSHVSTEWIESMNSLLDDSKLLCLANSERLKINDFINIMFECENLKHASPATVSRLGIINYPECTLSDTIKICQVQMRPQNGYKNMTEDEIQANENRILKAAVASSLEQSIVRWDHIVLSWLENQLESILMFKQLKQDVARQSAAKYELQASIESVVLERLQGLILRMFQLFIPHGLKFFITKAQCLLPSNEVQLVRQVVDVFSALLTYNRSLAVRQQLNKQQELRRIAEENGLQDAGQAPDVTSAIPIDVTLIIKFLICQYIQRNQQALSKIPDAQSLYAVFSEHVFNSEEYQAIELMIKDVFIFAFIWSFGGICAAGNKQAREEFDNLVRYIIEITNDEYTANRANDEFRLEKMPPFEGYIDRMPTVLQLPLIPNIGSVFDYYIDWQKLIDLQDGIAENLAFLSVGQHVREAVPQYQSMKNDAGFTVGSSLDFLDMMDSVVGYITGQLTEEQSVLLNTVLLRLDDIEFVTFNDLLKHFVYNPKIAFFQLFIETNDTLRYQHLMESLLKANYNVLLTGQSGSGKTSTVSNMLASLDRRQITQNIQINFSARTTSLRIQQLIEDQLIQKGRTYLPQIGKSGIIYIDDLNLPAKDQYECSQPIEFIRFFMDTKGFYDRKDLFWKDVQNTSLLSSCAQPGGGRETLTTRLTTSFVMIAQPESEDEGLLKIYNTILEGYLSYPDYKYPKDIIQSSQGIVKALITIYHDLSNILKPTPSKLHYSFNLRDVSKVIQGLMRGSSKILKTSEEFVRLFIHETMRVFADRTVSSFDNEQVCKCITEVLNTCPNTGIKKQVVYEQLFEDDGTPKQFEDQPPANSEFYEIWGNYMRFGTPIEERLYEAKDLRLVQQTVYQYLDQYNTESGKQKMNLVLFNDAIMYVSKIARILSSERGNLLNVGVGGSGRKSLTRLAAHICEYSVESIQLKKGYSQSDFHEDVRGLYLRCGLKNENIVFLLDESQLVSGAILEDVNNILNSGLISNLFDQKDMETIINTTRATINEQGLQDEVNTNNRASIYNFFIDKVRDRLHLVLCLSPSGDEFRSRLRTYPSLLTCTSIVWFHPWPRQALLDVSKKILTESLQKVDFSAITGPDASEDAKQKFAKGLAQKLAPVTTEIHSNTEKLLMNYAKETNRRHYLPPATFLDLLNIYSSLLDKRIREISTRLNQYKTGVQRLIDAKSQVEVLQRQQEELKPELEKKTAVTEELIAQIKVETVSVNQLRQKAMEDAAIVAAQTKDCQMIAADADKDVKACEPIIQEATRAVDNIDAGMIAEMKVVKVPTPLVFLTLQSVAALMGYKQDWPGCVQMMSNANFLNSLKEYDKNNIPDSVLKTLKKYTEQKNYELSAIEKVSVACKSLAIWVLAIEKYAEIYREVEPKRKRLQQANEDLAQKQAALKVKQDNLAKVEAEFQQLQDKYNKSNDEKMELQRQMDLTVARLSRAEQLTTALADERVRWIQQSEELQELMTMVVGDVFLASCGVSYFGVFNRQYRDKLMTYWHGLLQIYSVKTQPLHLIQSKGLFGLISSDEITIENWKDCDLPNDMQSIDNAVIMDQIMSSKWPLLIDPQNQASNFIKKLHAGKIKILKPSQQGLVHIFEQSIHDGDIILLDGIGEKLDPILQPIIEKQYITMPNGTNLVNLGGEQPIEVHPEFSLYLTTKLQNPRYSPETHAKLQVINFSISVDALEQQILSDVIQLEYPQLEQTRVELTKEESENKKQLIKLADAILYNLSNFEGSVLDNEPLIQVLNESKRVAQTIKEKEVESAATKKEIKKYYAYYKPIGIRAALLYFLISDMSMVEQMYLFALGYFKQIVLQEIKKVDDFRGDDQKIQERVDTIIDKITFNLFNSISRGLFEKDKQVFAMLLGIRIKQRVGEIRPEEWGLFVKNKVYADIYLSDPLNTRNKDSAKMLLGQIDKCTTIDKDRLLSVLQVMAYVDYLNPLANMIIQSMQKIQAAIDGNKQRQTELINYIISMDEKHLESLDHDTVQTVTAILQAQQTTPFQRLILLKFIADEYFYIATPQFIEQMIDSRYASIKPQSIRQLYNDSTQYSPILFIISEGVDPVAQTQQLASEANRTVSIISLGKGQTETVRKELQKATVEGKWVFLQNVHLASADFLPELEQIVETLGQQNSTQSQLKYITLPLNPSFRLFLSSTPVNTFPQSVLQASLKCTTEPPFSMKKNILRQVGMLESEKFEFEHLKDKIPEYMNVAGVVATWKRIVYSLIYFHSQVLERKKFGPQGYNLNYDFNDTDLEICVLTLEDFFCKIFRQEQEQQLVDSFVNLDWDAIEFIFSKIHYSGKVNDSWDKRCVKTLLSSVINANIVKCSNPRDANSLNEYNYVEGDNRFYTLSFVGPTTTIDDLNTHAQNLPSIDSTQVFGMSSNSDIVNQQSETDRILQRILGVSAECLVSLKDSNEQDGKDMATSQLAGKREAEDTSQQQKLSHAEKQAIIKQKITDLNLKVFGEEVKTKTQDEIVKDITDKLLAKLPATMSINDACQASMRYDENNIPLCMTTILKQEMERFNGLLAFIKESLTNVALAIKGDVILSQDLEEQYQALYIGKVPSAWAKIAYPSLKPLSSWFDDLILRVKFMHRWLTEGPPKSYWISGLYFPQGFVTALLQTHARRYKKSIDSLQFRFEFSQTEWEDWQGLNIGDDEPDSTAVWIHGLYLDCAFFNKDELKLTESMEGILYPKLPYVKFIPTDQALEKGGYYTCPVYKTSQRAGVLSSTGHSTNFILPLLVPTDKEQQFFIRLGTCALCQLDK